MQQAKPVHAFLKAFLGDNPTTTPDSIHGRIRPPWLAYLKTKNRGLARAASGLQAAPLFKTEMGRPPDGHGQRAGKGDTSRSKKTSRMAQATVALRGLVMKTKEKTRATERLGVRTARYSQVAVLQS